MKFKDIRGLIFGCIPVIFIAAYFFAPAGYSEKLLGPWSILFIIFPLFLYFIFGMGLSKCGKCGKYFAIDPDIGKCKYCK